MLTEPATSSCRRAGFEISSQWRLRHPRMGTVLGLRRFTAAGRLRADVGCGPCPTCVLDAGETFVAPDEVPEPADWSR